MLQDIINVGFAGEMNLLKKILVLCPASVLVAWALSTTIV
jgi:hypothetical protein